jgi:hypothetical protein
MAATPLEPAMSSGVPNTPSALFVPEKNFSQYAFLLGYRVLARNRYRVEAEL